MAYNWARDAAASYHFAIAMIRLALVVRGDVFPLEDEPVDIVMLAKL